MCKFACLFHEFCILYVCFLFFPQWPYGDICGISPVGKGQGTEFNLTFRKSTNKRSETLKFSTEHRTELLTEALVRTLAAASFHTNFMKFYKRFYVGLSNVYFDDSKQNFFFSLNLSVLYLSTEIQNRVF